MHSGIENTFIGQDIILVKKDGTRVAGKLIGILRSAGVIQHYTIEDGETGFLRVVLDNDLQESQ